VGDQTYKRDLTSASYNVPFSAEPVLSFYTSRGLSGAVHFLFVPQNASATAGDCVGADIPMNAASCWRISPAQGNFLRRRHQYKARTIELCAIEEAEVYLSCTSRVTTGLRKLKAMKKPADMIVGYGKRR